MYKLTRTEMDALRSIFPRVQFVRRTRKTKGGKAGKYYVEEKDGITKALKRIRSGTL